MSRIPATRFHEEVSAGPFYLFDGSFILEFLKPHSSRKATTLLRCTFKGNHALIRKGKEHPQAPPLHMHIDQLEAAEVLQGKVGITQGYELKEFICTPESGEHIIPKWVPHKLWPIADYEGDSTMTMCAYPDNVAHPMDDLFFGNILMSLSDAHEGKGTVDMFQMMAMYHPTASPLIMFPTAWYLGPLRWAVPHAISAVISWTATNLLGRPPLLAKYNKLMTGDSR